MKTFTQTIKLWLPFAVTITAFCLLVYASVQQSYRQGANDPQIQMAEDAADFLVDGGKAEEIIPAGKVSVAKSLAPFMIIYDQSGKELASSVVLDGKTPELPAGVLDVTSENGENRVTWQPRAGVRIASVIVSYPGGYVLAGRNLREVEEREAQLTTFVGITWVLALVATLVMILFGEWMTREKKQN
jgi:hypothetical protein